MSYKRWRAVLLLVLILLASGVVVFPIFWMVRTSLVPEVELFHYPPRLLHSPTIKGYVRILQEGYIVKWIANSILLSLGCVAVVLFSALLAGYALSRFRYRFNRVTILLLLVTQMVPPALVITPLYVIFARLGIVDSLGSLLIADSGITVAFAAWIFKGFLDEIPYQLEEAAMIDGCTRVGAFLKIAIPLSSPAIATVGAITFFDVYNEYMFALTLMTSQDKWVGSVGVASFIGHIATQWDALMAGTTLFALPPLLVFLIFQRYIIRGITAGALKF